MDQVRASASAKTAAEKLIAMRGKMEECGVDGEYLVRFVFLFIIYPTFQHPILIFFNANEVYILLIIYWNML